MAEQDKPLHVVPFDLATLLEQVRESKEKQREKEMEEKVRQVESKKDDKIWKNLR